MADANFEYVNLNDVDPVMKPVPQGPYKLRIVKTEVTKGVQKKDPTKSWRRFGLAVSIVDNPVHGGRQVYDGLFDGQKERRYLRKIMDATGVASTEGEDVEAWFARLPEGAPEFQAIVKETFYVKDGQTVPKNEIDFGSVTVAN